MAINALYVYLNLPSYTLCRSKCWKPFKICLRRKSSLPGGIHVDDGRAVDEEGVIGIRIEAERNNFSQFDKKP